MTLMTGSTHAAPCLIDGPTTVNVNQPFTLCAGTSGGYSYEWLGEGLATSPESRCVTVNGRSAGAYEYQLIVRSNGAEVGHCTQTVTVGGGGFGTLTCAITGPTSITSGATATLCAPQADRHSYSWYGPAGFTASTRCVTVARAGTYHLSIVNDLTGYVRECSHSLTVVGTPGAPCEIVGPDVVERGSSVQLCAQASADVTYRWDGPNNFSATGRCVVARTAGTYYLTVRGRSTGAEEQCSHRLDEVATGTEDCTISGPASIASGNSAELCSPFASNSTYSWTGPGSFRSSLRCIRVSAAGVYRLLIRNRSTGVTRECSFTLDESGPDDADVVTSDNCPRALSFWQQQCRRAAGGRIITPNDFTIEEMRAIARRVDELSAYFSWSDDVTGLCAALNPAPPLTNRKQAIRQYAALLANVAAGELNLSTRSGDDVGIDPGTSASFPPATTVGELIAFSERRLSSGRGNFSQLGRNLNAVNRGRGIGPVCQ